MLIRIPWDDIGIPFFSNNRYMMIIIVALIMIPVNMLNNMSNLSWSSLLGNILILSCIFIVLMYII